MNGFIIDAAVVGFAVLCVASVIIKKIREIKVGECTACPDCSHCHKNKSDKRGSA